MLPLSLSESTSEPPRLRLRLRLLPSPLEVPPTPSSPEACLCRRLSLFRVRPSDLSLHVLCEVRGLLRERVNFGQTWMKRSCYSPIGSRPFQN
ncbi:hypothetical protein BT93_G1518 [Corymbia citriodora subsp. variegata]|nr:hypothetical protein BT93_G1518 [Corymbia citriodora subsp. variegata]